MTQFNAGDRVRVVDGDPGLAEGSEHTVKRVTHDFVYIDDRPMGGWFPERFELVAEAEDMINSPQHYTGFSNDAEVIDISENLTANAAQALQYIARSSRIDGNNKSDTLEDLRKAQWFLAREIARLEEN